VLALRLEFPPALFCISKPHCNALLHATPCCATTLPRCCTPVQAAVRDAERCLGGASGLLGHAVQLGPHPYATLSLPAVLVSSSAAEGQAAQVLKTPFQVRRMTCIRRKSIAAVVVVGTQLQLPAEPTARQYATLSLPAALVSGSAAEGQAVQVLKTPFQVRHTMRAAAAEVVVVVVGRQRREGRCRC
jgi:hypothetical protein